MIIIPDARVGQDLEIIRGHGRNDNAKRAMWHALRVGIVVQHESLDSLLRELARNPSLMDACGFASLPIRRTPKPRVVSAAETGVARIEIPPPAEPVRAAPSSCNVSGVLANVIELEETLGMIGGWGDAQAYGVVRIKLDEHGRRAQQPDAKPWGRIGARRPRVVGTRHSVLMCIILIDKPHRPCRPRWWPFWMPLRATPAAARSGPREIATAPMTQSRWALTDPPALA